MSFNQSRSDKSETTQYRKSGRSASFNQQRYSSAAYGKSGGAGGGPAPSPSSSSSNRSLKKSNVQGGQSRVYSSAVNSSDSGSASSAAPRIVQNGAHVQPSLHGGASDAPVASTAPRVTELPAAQRSTPAIPKAPVSQPATMSSDTAGQSATLTTDTSAPKTPAKGPADASKGYAFQFGSLSPGFMDGMQIPARTTSAPPNLDEQKRNQARHDAYRAAPSLPMPAPKQQIPRKDMSAADQSNIRETHLPKPKKDTQVSAALPVSQTQKPSVHSIPFSSMQVPYHLPQVSVQFGGPNPQIQSQGVTASSLQMGMPMALPVGNAPQIQQPMYVQGLPPHPMQPQGIMHQAQSLGFPNPMGPQLGTLGINITSQYPQLQGGKFSGPRKTPIKITDPKTHVEVRLDKRADAYGDSQPSGLSSHTNVPPQSQPIQFAPTHSSNYFPNSYNASNLYFQPPSSVVASCQMASNSQPSRFNHPTGQGPQTLANTSVINSIPANKTGTVLHGVAEPSSSDNLHDRHNTISSASSGTVTVKPTAGSIAQKAVEPPSSSSSSVLEKGGSHKSSRPSGEVSLSHSQRDAEFLSEGSPQQPMPENETSASKSAPVATKQPMAVSDSECSGAFSATSLAQSEESLSLATNTDSGKKEALSESNSMKDHQKKTVKKGYNQFQHQTAGQPTSASSLPSYGLEHGSSSGSGTSDTVESKEALAPVIDDVSMKFVGVSAVMVGTSPSDASMSTVDNTGDNFTHVLSECSGVGAVAGGPDTVHHCKLDDSSVLKPLKNDTLAMKEQGQIGLPESSKQDVNSSEICTAHGASESADPVKQAAEKSALTATAFGNEVQTSETAEVRLDESMTCHTENNRIVCNMISTNSDPCGVAETVDNHALAMDALLSKCSDAGNEESSGNKFSALDQQSDPLRSSHLSVAMSKHEAESVENVAGSFSSTVPGSKEKCAELTISKSSNSRFKKLKEILQKADAAGTTSDLYMAYKGPEEKKENIISAEVGENISTGPSLKPLCLDGQQGTSPLNAEDSQNIVEPDDWEDAVDISTPKLETPNILEQAHGGLVQHDKNGNANTAKKYSRDFLLKFSEQCTGLPEGFEITTDIADALMSTNISHHVDRDSHSSHGRVIDRLNSGPRMDRRGSGIVDDDRWSKLPVPFGMGREMRVDIGYGGNIGFRPGQGGNFGVLRNPRAQSPVVYMGGILTGPMQSMGPQAGMQRNGPDADRWQRSTYIQQKGLIASPQTPLQMMHKAERKYEVGKVTDEEETKQRQLKAILNKLTPQNFERLFEQVKAVNIDNTGTLNGVISQIFDKALMEPTFCEMYANFCYHLAGELPDFSEDNEKITFKRLLLNKCQEEFERGEREQEEANKADEEGEVKQSKEEREEKRLKARRRMLGNIRLIGELYKKKMLTERIMHECIKKLLGQDQTPDEEDIEALCKLMSTIGGLIDHPKAKEHMDAYFDIMTMLSNNVKLSSRVRFMLKDAIDLRKNKWQQRRKVEGPKKIEEVHRDAAHERQQQAGRLTRNLTISSGRRGPVDFVPRGSAMQSSPSAQMGGFRGLPTQARGFGTQDVRLEERQPYEARTLSVSLPQRPLGDDSITLGPQGGLARGMSIRGPPAIASATVADSQGDSRRMMPGLNGSSNVPERPIYGVRDDLVPRFAPDRFTGPAAYDQLGSQERNISLINRNLRNVDRGFDRHLATSSPALSQGPALTQNVPSEKVQPEECLRDMSMAAIKEFYSARDEKEVALCIKDLNSSRFHPSMISLWITDSFEKKDIERDLLAKLLVNLTRSRDGILTPVQLIKGFESVLTTLEDAVNDAPKAAEFLGRIFAEVVLGNVVALGEISRLLHEGGEEPGRLLEVGLAGDVLGSTLEMIKAEKGENVLNDIRNSSNLRLEDFRPPDPNRSRILEKFI